MKVYLTIRNIFSGAVFIIFLFCSCNLFDSNSNIHLSEHFNNLSEYHLADFNLSDNYSYLETRINFGNDRKQQIVFSFDKSIADTLSSEQLKAIKEAKSKRGFITGCLPRSCPIYGVALLDNSNSVTLLTSDNDLLKFLGNIDTEAELNFWLWANSYTKSISYERQKFGYRAIVKWDNLCGKRGRDLVFISKDGKIKRIRRLKTEDYQGCV